MFFKGLSLDRKVIGLEVENGRIGRRTELPPENGLPRLLPALVDLQHNGALSHARLLHTVYAPYAV